MATFYGAQKSSADGVLSWYEEQDQSNYVIYRHNTKSETARYEGGDKDVGGQRLNRFLTEIEPTDFAIYILQLIPSSKKKDATAPSVTFQLYRNQPGQQYNPGMYQINEVVSKLNAIQSRLDSEEEEEGEESMEVGNIPQEQPSIQALLYNQLAGILSHPNITTLIVTAITNLAGNIMKPAQQPVTAVSGVEAETLEQSIELLLSKGVTPSDLAKLASMDQGQINFLLTMLRK